MQEEGVLADEMKGWHLMGQARLSKLEEQVLVGTCYTKDGYDHMKGELMRIFSDEGKKRRK